MNHANLYNFLISFYGKLSSILPFGFALPPIRAMIELTYHCNLQCYMCYLNKERGEGLAKKELSLEEIKKLIDQMPPKTLISLSGGELLTKSDALEIIQYAGRKHFCNIVTNGTLIDREIAHRLVRTNLILIGVSLDGLEAVHDRIRGVKGAFAKTTKGIKAVQNEKGKSGKKSPLVDIKTVILPENINQLYPLYKLCQKLKVDFFTISALKGSSIQLSPPILDSIPSASYNRLSGINNKVDIDLLERQLKKILKDKSSVKVRFYPGDLHLRLGEYYANKITQKDYFPCLSPWTGLNVSPYGDVFPCIALKVGNIREKNLGQIWNGKKMRQFRQNLKKSKVFPVCQGCCNLWFKPK